MFKLILDLIGAALTVCWGYMIVVDLQRGDIIWTLVDFFIVPIGMIRGFLLLIN